MKRPQSDSFSSPKDSPFLDQSKWISENNFAAALRDSFPVSPGHTLIVPKRLVSSVFELDTDEILGCWRLLEAERDRLSAEFQPDGFNVGVNVGEAAGQTIQHAHIHLIPRYRGDHPSPRGGVRAVVLGKADY